MKKIILAITFLITFTCSGIFSNALGENLENENLDYGYIKDYGKVKLVENDEKFLFESLNKENNEMYFQHKFTKVFDGKKGEFVENYKFKEGEEIIAFIRNNTPSLESLPPIKFPQFIVVNVNEKFSVDVDYYQKEEGIFKGISNRLILNSLGKGKITNLEGKDYSKENIENGELFVVYTFSTRSLPPQTVPERIYLLGKEFNKLNLNSEVLKKYKTEKGYPLRKVLNEANVIVNWDNNSKMVIITYNNKEVKLSFLEKSLYDNDEKIKINNLNLEKESIFIQEDTLNTIIESLNS